MAAGIDLPSGHIADLQAIYTHFDISQSHSNHDKKARKTFKYHQRTNLESSMGRTKSVP